jgi:LCP family protein required for cell wall assembly
VFILTNDENDFTLSRVNQRKKLQKQILIGIGIAALVALVALFAYSGYAYWKFINKISEGPNSGSESIETAQRLENQAFATLIIGLDVREKVMDYNTDVLIVAILNPETKKSTLLSIPRDTKVNIPGHGYSKINATYAIGEQEKRKQERNGEIPTISGTSLLLQVVSDYLYIPVNHYVFLDFQGFVAMVDQLGGITVNVDRYMNYVGDSDGTYINLKPGVQKLSGKQALDFARFRLSSDGNDSSDFARNRRHQEIIRSFVNELTSLNGLSNIFSILNAAGDHTKVSLSKNEILPLALKYRDIKSENIESLKFEGAYWLSPYVIVPDADLERIQMALKERLTVSEEYIKQLK